MSEVNSGSPKFALNASDALSISKNAALVGLAAALTYLGENLANIDLGTMGPLVVPVVAVVLNTVVKWARDNSN